MNRLRLGLLFPLVLVLVLTIMLPGRAAAQCTLTYGNGFLAASYLNNEGLKERPSDILIASGLTNCFSAGNTISITYNGILTLPTTLTNTSQPQYIVITNPAAATDGQLVLDVSTTSGISASGPQTVIQMLVIGATTDPAASITLQNLRFDVNGLAAAQLAPTVMNAFVSGSSAGLTAVSSLPVGDVLSTISTALGAEAVAQGAGQQSAGGPLTTQAVFTFATAPGWAISPFRVPIAAPAYPAACVIAAPPCDLVDNPTTATSLVVDVEGVPSGVTVTFPATLSIWPGIGAVTPTFQWKLRTSSVSGKLAQAIYDTAVATGTTFSLKVTTGAAAADSTAGTATVLPTVATIGVQIGSSSGSGTATLRVVFGPGGNPPGVIAGPAFTGDDFNASAVPNYTPYISTAGIGREIITDSVINPLTGVDTAPTAYFTIAPTQSVVLFQYATDEDSYGTGLAVSNTGSDSTIFSTKGQTGPVIFYLFQTGSTTPIIYQVKSGNGRGLDASGNLEPGNVFAISLDELLTDAGQSALVGTFSGYVIAQCEFDYGHGFDIVFNPNGIGTAVNALYLGSSFRNDVPDHGIGQ